MFSTFKTTAAATLLALSCQSADAAIRYVAQGGDSIGIGNRSIGATDVLELPPPPEEVNLIL